MAHVNGWAIAAIVELTLLLAVAGFAIWFFGVEGGSFPTIMPDNSTIFPTPSSEVPTMIEETTTAYSELW
jgi:hypothetical protein